MTIRVGWGEVRSQQRRGKERRGKVAAEERWLIQMLATELPMLATELPMST
jgi:hypothetical protein